MVKEYRVGCYCNSCLKKWAIEPEPDYPTAEYWAEANKTEAVPKVKESEVVCPFCGSKNIRMEEIWP